MVARIIVPGLSLKKANKEIKSTAALPIKRPVKGILKVSNTPLKADSFKAHKAVNLPVNPGNIV